MLRRRILASAMASVMAIGSVAVVASAEETAASTTQAKTKADLEAYVKSFDSFRDDALYDYGSVSGEKFLAALEYAENVIASNTATVDDYTVAYSMIEAVYNKLAIYTAEELKALVDKCKAVYDTENIYNEELGDPIYIEENKSNTDIKKYGWNYFVDAYEEAESVLSSSDSRIITDAYETLDDQYANLKMYPVVTKSRFRTALKDYETALNKEFKYESWRVGSLSTDWINLNAVDDETGWWGYQGQKLAWGTLYAHLQGAESTIREQYDVMDEIKSLNKTSDPEIVKACFAAENAVTVINDWTPDDVVRGSKASVQKLLNEYKGRLVYDYNTSGALTLYNAIKAKDSGLKILQEVNGSEGATEYVDAFVTTNANAIFVVSEGSVLADADNNGHGVYNTKTISAEVTVKPSVDLYVSLNKDGTYAGSVSTEKPDGDYKKLTKNAAVDITAYVAVSVDAVATQEHNEAVAYANSVIGGLNWQISQIPLKEDYAEKKAEYDKQIADLEDEIDWLQLPSTVAMFIGSADKNSVLDGFDTFGASCQVDHDHPGGDNNWVDDRIGKYGTVYGAEQTRLYGSIAKTYYTSSQTTKLPTTTNLTTALDLAYDYLTGDKDVIKASSIYDIDTTDSIAADTAKGSSAEWAMVYRYLKYALSDKYDAETGTKTKSDVSALIEKSYDLAEQTGDAALFAYYHQNLVDARKVAVDWLKAANKDKKYKDNISSPNGYTATAMYNKLNNEYTALETIYNKYSVSFEEVYYKIADVKNAIDDGELVMTDALAEALEKTAYYLSTCGAYSDEYGVDNDAFTSDRVFQGFNRLNTVNEKFTLRYGTGTSDVTTILNKDNSAVTADHVNLYEAYTALDTAVKAQTEPETKLGDANGDGVVNALDAAEILKASVGLRDAIDVKVGDYNADGTVNALDAAKILQDIVNGVL